MAMDNETKVAFRETRDSWAAEGCLPEGLCQRDIDDIASEVQKKVAALALLGDSPENIAKVADFIGKLSLLKTKAFIGERLYDESIGILSRRPRYRHEE